jgi:hypothetical protein
MTRGDDAVNWQRKAKRADRRTGTVFNYCLSGQHLAKYHETSVRE